MRTRTLFLLIGAVGAAVVAGALGLVKTSHSQAPVVSTPRAIELAPADLVAPQRRPVADAIALTGTLNARNQTLVKAKVAGELRELLVRAGEAVRAGQTIARIDSADAQARLQEKLADLEGGRAQLAYAARNREQQMALLQQKFISENAFENAESSYRVAEAKLKALQAQVAIAQKSVDDATVRAPMSGIVAERFAQPGEKVAVDGKLATIVDLGQLEIEAAVPASDIAAVRVGQPVQFEVEGYEGRTFTGHVERINPQTQSGTRSIMIYAVVPNQEGVLRAGVFAKGVVTVARRDNALTVPIGAIREEGATPFVYVVENGVLEKRAVKLGVRNVAEGIVEVSGLVDAARVVKSNLGTLRVGSPVKMAAAAS